MSRNRTNNKLSDWLPGLVIVTLMGIGSGVFLFGFYFHSIQSVSGLLMLLVLPYSIPVFSLLLMGVVWYYFVKTYIMKKEPRAPSENSLSLTLLVMLIMLLPYFVVDVLAEHHFDVTLFLIISLAIILLLYNHISKLQGARRKRAEKLEMILEFLLNHFEQFSQVLLYFLFICVGCFLIFSGLSSRNFSERIVLYVFGGLILAYVSINAYLRHKRKK